MTEQFDEFLEEVEKDIRQARLEKLWKEYGKVIMLAVGVVLLAVTLYFLWSNQQEKRKQQLSEMFVNAYALFDQGKNREAMGLLDEIANASHPYYMAMSQFAKAAHLSESNQKEDLQKAMTIYENMAQQSNLDEYMRELGLLRSIMLKMDQADIKNDPMALKKYLADVEPLIAPGKPWRLLAMEAKAVILDLLKDPKALDVFIAIAQDPKASKGLRQRAQMMTQTLGSEEVQGNK